MEVTMRRLVFTLSLAALISGFGLAGITDCESNVLQITSTAAEARKPSIAWNGDGYGVVWSTEYVIYFARLDATGQKIGTDVELASGQGSRLDPRIVWTGSEYGIVWEDQRDGIYGEIYFILLDVSGEPLIGAVRVTDSNGRTGLPSIAWTGTEFGLAWQDERQPGRGIYFTRMSAEGVKIGDELWIGGEVPFASFYSPSLVWNGAGYGLVWVDNIHSNLFFTRLDPSGNELGNEIEIESLIGAARAPTLVWNGSGYAVVWLEWPSAVVFFRRLDASGAPIGSVFEASSFHTTRPAIAWNGSHYAVVWRNGDEIRLARRAELGHRIGDDLVATVESYYDAWRPGIAWNGADWGVVWDSGGTDADPYFSDVQCSCDASDVDADGFSHCDGDCDRFDGDSFPDAPELCDGNDNDCDETVPSDEIDHDLDLYVACSGWDDAQGDQPWILGGGDCHGTDPTVHPGALEICDRLDSDCNGLVDLDDPGVVFDPDTDGDALPDCWEVYGLDVNDPDLTCKPGAATACDLPLQESPYLADRLRRDLYVEIDYMDCTEGGCAPDHDLPLTHRPHDTALARVASAFAHRGITVHFLVDEPLPEIEPILFGPEPGPGPADDFWDLKWGSSAPQDPCTTGSAGAHFGTVADRLASDCIDRIDARRRVMRYAVFGHSSSTGWGTAEIDGNDMLVGLGGGEKSRAARDLAESWDADVDSEWADMEAGILMHSLGHNLGLGHGGVDPVGEPTASPGCKPNHFSVMNFTRVWNVAGSALGIPGLPDGTPARTDRVLDYSDTVRPLIGGELDELALDESVGVSGPSGEVILFGGGAAGTPIATPAADGVDWNANGSIDGGVVARDVNFVHFGAGSVGCPESPGEILPGSDDWSAIRLRVPPSDTIVDTPSTGPGPAPAFPSVEPDIAEYLDGGLGSEDIDGDGIPNREDACPLAFEPGHPDTDGDGYGDRCDCLAEVAAHQDRPSEVRSLRMSGKTTLSWFPPVFHGTNATTYDVLRSSAPDDFLSPVCIDPDPTGLSAEDGETPVPPGAGFYYLVRANSGCPDGLGSLGLRHPGIPRTAPACP
jgi:hypothetical protein